MLKLLTDYLLSAANVVEAEVKHAEDRLKSVIAEGVMMFVAAVVLLTAVGFLLASAFLAIASALGATLAALLVGGGTFLLALVIMAMAKSAGK